MSQPPLDDEGTAPPSHRYTPSPAPGSDADGTSLEPDEDYRPLPAPPPSPPPMSIRGLAAIAAGCVATVAFITGIVGGNGLAFFIAVIAGVIALILALQNQRGSTAEAEENARTHVKGYRHYHYPSKRAARVLNETETMYFETHEHPITMLPWALLVLAATAAAGWIGKTAGDFRGVAIFWVGLMCFIGFKVWIWQRETFIVTDQFIRMTSGIAEDHAPRMNIAAVTDAKKYVPWHSKLLFALGFISAKYGTFNLETAGQDQPINKVNWLPYIDELDRVVSALSRGQEPYPQPKGPETSFPY